MAERTCTTDVVEVVQEALKESGLFERVTISRDGSSVHAKAKHQAEDEVFIIRVIEA